MSLEGHRIGRFRLLRKLNRGGGTGEVYHAEDTATSQEVTVKLIEIDSTRHHPHYHMKLRKRISTIAELKHPHIVPVLGFGEEIIDTKTFVYLALPLHKGGSLAHWLRQRNRTDILLPQDVDYLIQQAAEALQYIHEQQLVHLYIRPSSFIIRNNPENPNRPFLILSDFWIADMTVEAFQSSQTVHGITTYLAPELLTNTPVLATDQYALAIMAYELLMGYPPFQVGAKRETYQHFVAQRRLEGAIDLAVAAEIDAALSQALAEKPEERFATIAAFASAFQEAGQRATLETTQKRSAVSLGKSMARPAAAIGTISRQETIQTSVEEDIFAYKRTEKKESAVDSVTTKEALEVDKVIIKEKIVEHDEKIILVPDKAAEEKAAILLVSEGILLENVLQENALLKEEVALLKSDLALKEAEIRSTENKLLEEEAALAMANLAVQEAEARSAGIVEGTLAVSNSVSNTGIAIEEIDLVSAAVPPVVSGGGWQSQQQSYGGAATAAGAAIVEADAYMAVTTPPVTNGNGMAGGVGIFSFVGGASTNNPPVTGKLRGGKNKHRRWLVIAAALLLLLFLGVFFFSPFSPVFASTATVTLTLASHELQESYVFSAVTNTTTIDSTKQQVSARLVSAANTLSQTVHSTGKGRTSGTQASGTLTLYNTITACNCAPIIPAGTLFTDSQGISVVTEQTVSVAALCTVNVPAHVVQYGPIGNIPAHDIHQTQVYKVDTLSMNIIIDNPAAFSGGVSGQDYVAVQQSDIDGATNTLTQKLQQSTTAALQAQLHTNERLIDKAKCIAQSSADHTAGADAPAVTVSVTTTCSGETYDYQSTLAMTEQFLKEHALTYFGTEFALSGTTSIEITHAVVVSSTDNTVLLTINAWGKWVYKFSNARQQLLANLIAGKNKQDVQTLLSDQQGVMAATIEISGLYNNTLPNNPNNIILVFKN